MNAEAFEAFPVLETERLLLREMDYKDTKAIYDILSDEALMKYYGMYPITEFSKAFWFIDRYETGYKEHRLVRWGIVHKETNKLIGTCGFHGFNDYTQKIEMGYELSGDYHGQGLMREALNAIIAWGFSTLGSHRIEALIYPENKASISLIERLGFSYEGHLRDYAFFRDQYTSLNMYSLLEEDFLNESTDSRG